MLAFVFGKDSLLAALMDKVANWLRFIGLSMQLGQASFIALLKGRWRPAETLRQSVAVAYDAIPMIVLLASIGGGVLALQSARQFAKTGADGYVGGLVALAIVREIAPIFTAMAVGARSGTAMASELAHMSVTNQLDALHVMRIHPARYLVQPRLLASALCMPMVTLIAEISAVLFGMIVANLVTGLSYQLYIESVWLTLKPYDVITSLIKAFIFGVIVSTSACSIGLATRGGAKEVGMSAMRAAVWAAILVIIMDFLLSWIFYSGDPLF